MNKLSKVLAILIVLALQACTRESGSEVVSESRFPIRFANILAFQIEPNLKVDSTNVNTAYALKSDTIVSGAPMTSCICSKNENGVSISVRDYRGFESKYLDIDYDNQTYDAEINYKSDLPDPETNLFRQSLKLNKVDFFEGDTLSGQVRITGILLDQHDITMDSVQFISEGLFQCVVQDSTYDWMTWNDDLIAEYNIDRVMQFTELAHSDSALSIKRLDLNNLGLTSIPNEIVNFENLEELWMIGNDVSHFDINLLKRLKHLKLINLDNSAIEELPVNISELSALEVLSLDLNPLKTLPGSIYQLQNLKELSLSLTKISRIDPAIGKLTSLEKLDLSSNYHLYAIPQSVFELQNLRELQLPTVFDSFETQGWGLDKLESLWINYSILESRPDIIQKLKGLNFLYIYHEFPEGTEKTSDLSYRQRTTLESKLPEVTLTSFVSTYKRENAGT